MALSTILSKMDEYYNLFDLVYSDHDVEEHYFFEGPADSTEEEFERICESLIPKAGYKAALKRSDPESGGWICWSDVVESLVPLLEEQGYQRVYLDTYVFQGGTIVGMYDRAPLDERLGFSARMIAEHNRKIEEKLAKEREARRSLKTISFKKKPVQIIK